MKWPVGNGVGGVPDLTRRAPELRERMDDPACDLGTLHRTYEQFSRVNLLVAGWPLVYRRVLRPRLTRARPYRALDIGCGGGDVARRLSAWAARDGFTLRVLGLDADERAIRYARSQPAQSGLSFRVGMSHDLVQAGERFDFVFSNHLLHHLSDEELRALLSDSEQLCEDVVLHSDIERHPLAYAGFALGAAPFFRRSFIVEDGLRSVRRSFTAPELRTLAPPGWQVNRPWPFRLLLRAEGGRRG